MKLELITRILSTLILIPIALFFIVKGSIFFNFFIIVMLLITFYEWHFLSLKKNYYLPGFIFIIFSFYTFYFIGNQGDTGSLFHRIYFFLILLICIATDIGGYVFGKIFKGPKITKISPNKTYAGMIGGFVLSIISASLYFNNLSFLSLSQSKGEMGIQIFFIVLSISFVSQVGDLVISFFKRKSKIKNTGNIIPGHGGLLDRIDGMIFAFPYSFLLMKYII
tara:strand:+ start:635 stop:1300 length:666 start_codon:yes stop_codon:yes gene_type:complete